MGKYNLIVGPTGVGKSSLINYLQKHISCVVYSDPFEDNPFIKDAYLGNSKNFQSQIFFFKEFLKLHKEIRLQSEIIVQERSIFESVHIFCASLLRDGVFTKDEYAVFEDLLTEVRELINIPDKIISLSANSDTILKRIAKRGRDFENGIDIKFVEGQRLLYEKWIDRIRSEWKCSINTFNTDLVSIEELGESVLKEIII